MDPVVAAVAAGAVAGLTSTTSEAVRDAYQALKAVLRERFPQVEFGPIEERPDSDARQATLTESLMRAGAARDAEVLQLAHTLVAAIVREAPHAASSLGVDLERVRAAFLAIERVEGGVRAHHVTTSGGITIADVRAGGGPDPNL